MKLDYKGWAIIVLAAGAVAGGGGYMLGMGQKQSGAAAPASSANESSSGSPLINTATAAAASPTHPSMAGAKGAGNGKFTHFRVGNRNVKGMYADGNIIWIGTSGGVIRYDVESDNFRIFDNKTKGLLSNGIFHVSKLGDKIVAGTYGGGLSVYDPKTDQWKNLNIPDGLADQFVYDVQKVANGDVWIATWSGVNRVRGGALEDASKWDTFTVESTQRGLPNPWVYALEEGKNGEMWFATEEGLARYKDGKWQNWQHEEGLGAPLDAVKDAIQFTNDPAKSSSHHAQQKAEQGLQDVNVAYNPNYIISLKVDRQGIVWCGTWGGGLARFDGKTWRNFTTADGLPANHIFMLYLDPQGKLWAGTNRGLARLNDDGKSFTVMTTADGLYADNVFSMTNAADGSLWIGSFGGVAHLVAQQ